MTTDFRLNSILYISRGTPTKTHKNNILTFGCLLYEYRYQMGQDLYLAQFRWCSMQFTGNLSHQNMYYYQLMLWKMDSSAKSAEILEPLIREEVSSNFWRKEKQRAHKWKTSTCNKFIFLLCQFFFF